MIVMKFSGKALGDADAMARAIGIVRTRLTSKPVVVVSALAGVTNTLFSLADAAREHDADKAAEIIEALRLRHTAVVDGLLATSPLRNDALSAIEGIFHQLEKFVEGLILIGEVTQRSTARIVACGERLTAWIFINALRANGIEASRTDAFGMIVTNNDYLNAEPDIKAIKTIAPVLIGEAFKKGQVAVVPGFIGSDSKGETTIMGRGSSDFTASLLGMALGAEVIEIWTLKDGIRTADPAIVAQPKIISKISFEEAAEMAHLGTKVLHPLSIVPAVMCNIPVRVLNATNPDGAGTIIVQNSKTDDGAKAISYKEKVLLLNIFSPRMIDVSGFLSRVFDIFASNNVSVDLISTSEASISITCEEHPRLNSVVVQLSQFCEVRVADDKAQVSIVGKNVANQRGLLRYALTAFNNTNIYMISQGASFVNVSFVVDRTALPEVVQDLHCYLFE